MARGVWRGWGKHFHCQFSSRWHPGGRRHEWTTTSRHSVSFHVFFPLSPATSAPQPQQKKKKIVFTEGFSIFKHGHTSCLDIHLIPFLFPSFFICHYQLPGIGDVAPEGLQMCGDWRQRRIMACIVIMVIVHFLFKVGICVSFQWWPKCSPPFLLQEKSPWMEHYLS